MTDLLGLLILLYCVPVALLLMLRIAVVDLMRWEIETEALVSCALILLPVVLALEGRTALWYSLLAALALYGVAACIMRWFPSRMSHGDVGLFGFLGLVGAWHWLSILLIFFACGAALTSRVYALSRGKGLWGRSLFPAALPAMAAAACVLIWRVRAGLSPTTPLLGTTDPLLIWLFAGACILGPLYLYHYLRWET